jgi:hypothetical protein
MDWYGPNFVYPKCSVINLMTRYLIPSLALLAATVLFAGCEGIADLDVPNTNEPTRDAIQGGQDLESLLGGATTQTFQVTVTDWGPHMDLLADQSTTTNAFRSFWDFAEEPRLTLNPRTTYADPAIFADPFSNLNSGQVGANRILEVTEVDEETIVTDNGEDITQKLRASAYLTRGVARGYLGLIYDQGYVTPEDLQLENINATELETQSYSELISAAVSDLEQAISIAENNSFTWDLLIGNSYSSAEFEAIAHSFAARFLMGEARTRQELNNYTDERLNAIIRHADAGVGQSGPLPSFSPASTGGEFWNSFADWSTFVISGPAGYIPVDVKISHLLDPSYPVEYPSTSGEVLPPHETSDPRAEYFLYTDAFGFLSAARNRSLFSNYLRLRNGGGNDWFNYDGVAVSIVTGSEMQYLKAEANLLKGNKSAAAQALENSPFGTVPTELTNPLPSERGDFFFGSLFEDGVFPASSFPAEREISSSASRAEFVRALHTEYSVELDLMAGVGAQWYFMRRHDLLQEGTALHYPLPGEELEIIQQEFYTFGGVDRAGESGTATGDNSWRTFDERHGIDGPVGYSKDAKRAKSKKALTPPDAEVEPPRRAKNY